jgi:hypothetical protein
VTLARRATRLTHRGRTVTGRLGLRFRRPAGRELRTGVSATDRRGLRQVVAGAGTVRIRG